VTDLVDADDAAGPPPSDGLTLVGETKSFLKTWQRLMRSSEDWGPEDVVVLRQKARDLESRARAADVGSLAHHLASCEHCFWNGEVDKAKLAHCLRNVSEVAWQWRQDLRTRSELVSIEGLGHLPADRLTIEPPTLLEPPSVQMFESVPPSAEPARPSTLPSEPPSALQSDGFEQALEMWNRPSLLARLFGRRRNRVSGVPAPVSASPYGLALHEPASNEPDPRAVTLDELAPHEPASESESRQKGRKPLTALPSLSDAAYSAAAPGPSFESDPLADVSNGSSSDTAGLRRGWPRWSVSVGLLAVLAVGIWVWFEGASDVPDAKLASAPSAPAVATATSTAAALRQRDAERVPLETASRAPAVRREVLDGLLAGAHGYGGMESPELADLLDEEAALLASGGAACVPGIPGCELVSTSHELGAAPNAARAQSGVPVGGSWLEGLELPGIGVKDDPRVRELFEFHTRNAVGRETFQELLFRCGTYLEVVQTALDRYGLSLDLFAVPMVASGCVPDVESVDGGRGLWQLTPAAAKGYHLRLKPQVVDERIDPAKSSDAAARLLQDLFRKTGSWELALAAYRSGPLALLARLKAAGDGAGYWQLAASGRLPDEAVKLVPKVQAFALILANLAKFRFEPVPHRPLEVTATLEVPPGTRLGLVARAAGSSTTKIRELNPDMLGDRVPDWPGEKFVVRVPKDAGVRARESLGGLIASADHADECVPHGFDWGRQRFTIAMASRCEQHASAGAR
jgi:hypothetical protein